MDTGWVPGAVIGTLGSVGAWLLSWRINSAKQEQEAKSTRNALEELKSDFRAGMEEIRKLADATARLQSSQGVVNTLQSKALDAVVARQDQHADKLADHSSSLKLLLEMVPMLRQTVDDLRKQADSNSRLLSEMRGVRQ